jgi:dimethylhistidine N-methyltransferase
MSPISTGVLLPSNDACDALEPTDSVTLPLNGSLQKKKCQEALVGNDDLVEGLSVRSDLKRIPVRFLYDDRGSQLYEDITALEEYYPYKEEESLLRKHAKDIVLDIPKNSIIIELGCGDGSKTSLILQALSARDGPENVHFLGIDVSSGALAQAKKNLQKHCPSVPEHNMEFVAAEYQPGLLEARRRHPAAKLCILWLGSSVGNFTDQEAVQFLEELRLAAGSNITLLLCADLWKDASILKSAYSDSKGVTKEFIINGMIHALRTLKYNRAGLKVDDWDYEAVVNTKQRQVEMYVIAKNAMPLVLPNVSIAKGERILMEISRKFTPENLSALAFNAGFHYQASWNSAKYSISFLIPAAEALKRCWEDTEAIYAQLDDWLEQPIELRHPFAFYYGHVAAFLRLKVAPSADPNPMDITFSRGIDPNVLDPSCCHAHPAVPTEWPSPKELQMYVRSIREEVMKLVEAKQYDMESLAMSLEHERMHQETLCYMLAMLRKQQWENSNNGGMESSNVQLLGELPSGNGDQKFGQLLTFYMKRCKYTDYSRPSDAKQERILVKGGTVNLGVAPLEDVGFVWDNEIGTSNVVHVKDLNVSKYPITVSEFRSFVLNDKGYDNPQFWSPADFDHLKAEGRKAPIGWSMPSDVKDLYIHLPEGTFHWSDVSSCPVYCSLAEASAFASAKGGRIMTEAEFAHFKLTARDTIVSLDAGGWEWTSSEFQPLLGFKPNPLYPEYSADFFDGCHYVLKGSSPYTHPSMRRETFRNYYQRQYAYVTAKFRVIWDTSTEKD